MQLTEFFVGSHPHQMYVQHLRSSSRAVEKGRVVFVHGGAHSGVGWTTTPDGRRGWAQIYADLGWDAYVVDWPGVGRSGWHSENLSDTPDDIVRCLVALLEKIGPSVIVGHSIGGAVAIKLTERYPTLVLGLVALAPASVEKRQAVLPPAPLDQPATTSSEAALLRFANTARFPSQALDQYFASITQYGPQIRNAALGANDFLKIDRSVLDVWKSSLPVLILAAEEDATVPPHTTLESAGIMGVYLTMLGRDWDLHGHGHLFIVETGSEVIAARVEDWISERLSPETF